MLVVGGWDVRSGWRFWLFWGLAFGVFSLHFVLWCSERRSRLRLLLFLNQAVSLGRRCRSSNTRCSVVGSSLLCLLLSAYDRSYFGFFRHSTHSRYFTLYNVLGLLRSGLSLFLLLALCNVPHWCSTNLARWGRVSSGNGGRSERCVVGDLFTERGARGVN